MPRSDLSLSTEAEDTAIQPEKDLTTARMEICFSSGLVSSDMSGYDPD